MTDDEALEALFAMANVQDGYAKKATDPGLKLIYKANAKAQREVAATIKDLRARLAAAEGRVGALTEALRLIELIGYREGEDFGWINAHMRGVATAALSGDSIDHYWRLFPNHRHPPADTGEGA